MPVVLFRIDERLIHGQVVVGWGSQLHPDVLVVVDDELAVSTWEQDLYCMGLPPNLEIRFLGVEEARAELSRWRDSPKRIFVLTRDVQTMSRLAEGGTMAGEEVNLGGIHHAPGREQVLPYVFLSAEEREELGRLTGKGVRVTAQDLPGARRVPMAGVSGGSPPGK